MVQYVHFVIIKLSKSFAKFKYFKVIVDKSITLGSFLSHKTVVKLLKLKLRSKNFEIPVLTLKGHSSKMLTLLIIRKDVVKEIHMNLTV